MRDRHLTNRVKMIALPAVVLLLAGFWLFSVAFAQQTPTPDAPQPTSPFDLNLPPTPAPFTTPTAPPSLTGVNGYAERGAVSIRSGPGLGYPRIGALQQGQSIDILGYNGYDLDRPCSANFAADLDMWVMVSYPYRSGYGWMARCALRINGAFNMERMLINTPPEGAPLPTGFPVTPLPR